MLQTLNKVCSGLSLSESETQEVSTLSHFLRSVMLQEQPCVPLAQQGHSCHHELPPEYLAPLYPVPKENQGRERSSTPGVQTSQATPCTLREDSVEDPVDVLGEGQVESRGVDDSGGGVIDMDIDYVCAVSYTHLTLPTIYSV